MTVADRPPLQVVVVAYGEPGPLEACLAALEGAHPVTVVDNSSSPATEKVAAAHGAGYLDPGSNLGFAAGVNHALAHLGALGPGADFDVLLLNPDAAITPEAVDRLHRALLADPGLACVAPAQTDPGGSRPARVAWPFPSPLRAWVEAAGGARFVARPDFVIGSVLLIRGRALRRVGPLDERFFLYAEEADWQMRAARSGWRSGLVADVTATHVGAGTGGSSERREVHFHASHERLIRKHYGASGWQAYRAAQVAGAAIRAVAASGPPRRAAAGRLRLYLTGPVRAEAAQR